MPGSAKALGIGGDGSAWMIGTDNSVSKFNPTANAWQALPSGAGLRISVDAQGSPRVVNNQNVLWRYQSASGSWSQLDGHVVLDLECLDRIYLNAYVPSLQVGGQVVTFFNQQRNQPIASPALFQKMGETFRQAVATFAKRQQIPVIRFGKRDR